MSVSFVIFCSRYSTLGCVISIVQKGVEQLSKLICSYRKIQLIQMLFYIRILSDHTLETSSASTKEKWVEEDQDMTFFLGIIKPTPNLHCFIGLQ